MRKLIAVSTMYLLLNGCGGSNFNELFVGSAEKESLDQVLTEAKYAYDKGEYDKVLQLTEKVQKLYPYHEEALVLKSNAYLAKADFDVMGIVNAILTTSDSSSTKLADSGAKDATTNLLGKLAKAFPLSEADLSSLSKESKTVSKVRLYIPKNASEARGSTDSATRMYNLSQAVTALCPLLRGLYSESDASYKDLPIYKKGTDGTLQDKRYIDCGESTEAAHMGARSKFTWALANIAEAVAFYSVVMYSSDTVNSTPNIETASLNLKNTTNVSDFLSGLDALTSTIESIFPTQNADDSMLNSVFSDLASSSVALGSIAGMPSSVSSNILSATTNLQDKIKTITKAPTANTASSAQQNEALKNTFTKTSAEQISGKIATITDPTQKTQACALFKKLNSDATALPSGC